MPEIQGMIGTGLTEVAAGMQTATMLTVWMILTEIRIGVPPVAFGMMIKG
jgi:hypothetical protein